MAKTTEINQAIGYAIKEGLARKHMTQSELAGIVGSTQRSISSYREIQKLKKELYTIIADHSHTDFDKVWADSDRDYWMTAQEAKEYGMIDEVLSRKPAAL